MIAQTVSQIIDTLSYATQFYGKTFLIKLGGSILNDDALITSLCFDLKLLKQAGIQIIIVHGGSKAINQRLAEEGVNATFVDGLRVTSSVVMKIIENVLCCQVNAQLVTILKEQGVQAVGLSGKQHNMLLCDYHSQAHGYVGVVRRVNIDRVMKVLSKQSATGSVIPVIAPIGVNAQGEPMNVNADYAASQLAIALQVDKLIYLTDQDGIYDENKKVLSELCTDDLVSLVENNIVHSGMLVKVKAILSAHEQNLNCIHILNGRIRHVLLEELFTTKGVGTFCQKSSIRVKKLESLS